MKHCLHHGEYDHALLWCPLCAITGETLESTLALERRAGAEGMLKRCRPYMRHLPECELEPDGVAGVIVNFTTGERRTAVCTCDQNAILDEYPE